MHFCLVSNISAQNQVFIEKKNHRPIMHSNYASKYAHI